jgi:hypothetical protein
MAEVEAAHGASATYFPDDAQRLLQPRVGRGRERAQRLRDLGHRVGLHAVHPHVDFDERFDPVLAWHNPIPEFMTAPVDGLVNVMSPPWFDPAHYRSDSNQHWRHGDPTPALAAREFEWLKLLTHPEIWVYDGATMRESMESMLAAQRDASWARLARIGSTSREAVTVLLTRRDRRERRRSCGRCARTASATSGWFGVDMSERSIGRHVCDSFALVPASDDDGFVDALRDVVEREGVDVVLPQSSYDLPALAPLASASPRRCSCSSPETVRRSNDKAETYELLRGLGMPAPRLSARARRRAVEAAARELGYPDRDVAVKPVFSRDRGASGSSRRAPTGGSSCSRTGRSAERCGSRSSSSCSATTRRSCS